MAKAEIQAKGPPEDPKEKEQASQSGVFATPRKVLKKCKSGNSGDRTSRRSKTKEQTSQAGVFAMP